MEQTCRGPLVAGLVVGVLACSGTAARAASLPVTIRFDQGTVAVGTFPTAVAATAAAPATLRGTIDPDTFAASFPASSVLLPDAVVESADYGTAYGSGRFVVDAVPGAFTGTVAPRSASLELRGLIAYRLTATTALGTFTCVSDTPVPLVLAGTTDPSTGAYAVTGEQISLTIRPEHPEDALEAAFCWSQAQKVSPGAPVRSAFSGTLMIPGVVPTPAVTIPPPTPTTTTTPARPAATARAGRLAVSVLRPRTVRRRGSTVTKVVVRNTGAGTARSVAVVVSSGRGVTPSPARKRYASIPAGESRTFLVRLRTTRRASRRSTVEVRATGASGLRASRSTSLRLR